ncbi:MAG: Rrf2 family transcriptional regulator [Planctomycetales bacterium]|nr:Rrf2 family transcriptional regulator [Planctomycetales bacterium]
MRLSLQTDYGLRSLIYLAGRPGRAQIREIADFYRISKDHVAKAVRRLAQEGFIRSVRGVGGGIELARPAAEISVGEVIKRLEGALGLLDCTSVERVCVIQPACRLKGVLAKAEQIQRDYLQSVALSDVVQPAGNLEELVLIDLA